MDTERTKICDTAIVELISIIYYQLLQQGTSNTNLSKMIQTSRRIVTKT